MAGRKKTASSIKRIRTIRATDPVWSALYTEARLRGLGMAEYLCSFCQPQYIKDLYDNTEYLSYNDML